MTQVVTEDGAGHRADPEGIKELDELGLIEVEADRVGFTNEGERVLAMILDAFLRAGATVADRTTAELSPHA